MDEREHVWRSPAAARSRAAWRRRRPTTARAAAGAARTASADRARATVEKTLSAARRRGRPGARAIVTDLEALARGDVRRRGGRRGPRRQGRRCSRELERDRARPDAILASTTSSLSVERAGRGERAPGALRRPARLQPGHEDAAGRAGLPAEAARADARSARWRCARRSSKTPVEVPDVPGFVVNRLLFPYLFSAVRLLERPAWSRGRSTPACSSAPATRWGRSRCSTSSASTSRTRSARRSASRSRRASSELIAEGALGRKSGRGLHIAYERGSQASCLRPLEVAAAYCPVRRTLTAAPPSQKHCGRLAR